MNMFATVYIIGMLGAALYLQHPSFEKPIPFGIDYLLYLCGRYL